MRIITKLGRKSQIVIPKEMRKKLGISEGDQLIVDLIGDKIVLMQKPDNYSKKLKGLHKEIWEGIDAKKYIDIERNSW